MSLSTENVDREHHLHPWTDFATVDSAPLDVVVRGEGMYVFDAAGNRFLDSNGGGLSAVTLGYGNTEIAEAVEEQIRELHFFSNFGRFSTPPTERLAAKLAELAPAHLNHVAFATSGSVANETAIRLIHFYFNRLGLPDKKRILAYVEAYHGSTIMAATMTGIPFFRQGFDVLDGLVEHLPAPNVYRRPEGMSVRDFADTKIAELRATIERIGPERVACLMAEPIMTVGGVLVAPPGFHRRAQALCAEYEVMYVADEVVTAFGRLGHFFSSEAVFGTSPDVITTAKGLTSGYLPLSGTLFSDDIYEVIKVPPAPDALFTHGFTYSGHPVCCAAALKVIEIIERDGLCDRVRELGPYLAQQLGAFRELPLVGDVRGDQFLHGIELVADKVTRELLPSGVQISKRIARRCQDLGVLVRPMGHIVILAPPIVASREQLDSLVDALRQSIEATAKELMDEGLWSD